MEHLDHPSPQFNDAKMARFCSFAPSSLLWGGRGLIVPFYSVQDCSRIINILSEYIVARTHANTLLINFSAAQDIWNKYRGP